MGDIFERMGNLLREKIENEKAESMQDPECKVQAIENEDENSPDTEIPLSTEELSILNSHFAIQEKPAAERIPAGNYTEDTPVKIITGTADFS